jgi:DNA methylase
MQKDYQQFSFSFPEYSNDPAELDKPALLRNGNNTISAEDRAFHDWYRFVLSFPPHLVREYIQNFGLTDRSTILDPFCGTGTTVVEAKLHQIQAAGLEANPFAHFASSVKTE